MVQPSFPWRGSPRTKRVGLSGEAGNLGAGGRDFRRINRPGKDPTDSFLRSRSFSVLTVGSWLLLFSAYFQAKPGPDRPVSRFLPVDGHGTAAERL